MSLAPGNTSWPERDRDPDDQKNNGPSCPANSRKSIDRDNRFDSPGQESLKGTSLSNRPVSDIT